MTAKKRATSLLVSAVAVSTIAGNVGTINAQAKEDALKDQMQMATTTASAVNDKSSETKLWHLGDAVFNKTITNERTTIQGIVIDTTAQGAKFNAEGRDNAQVTAKTILQVPVEGASTVEIKHGYDKGPMVVKDPEGNVMTTIDSASGWTTTAFAYAGNEAGYLTLEVTEKDFYIQSIKVKKAPTTPMTLTVGANGTYKEVQEALDAIDYIPTEGTRVTVLIEPGVYTEEITVSKPYITFKSADASREVKLTYDKASGHDSDKSKDKGTQDTASVTVLAPAIGFEAYDITFENSYNLYQESLGDAGRKQTQAVALVTFTDRVILENCRFIGRQDTLYLKGASKGQNTPGVNERRVYLKNCYIEGTVDFIFGDATAVFEDCQLHMAYYSNGGHYTAANTNLQSIGYVFNKCKLTVDEAYNAYVDKETGELSKNIDLGRPWQGDHTYPYFGSHTVFIDCEMSPLIKKEGWSVWDATTITNKVRYMEYGSHLADGSAIDMNQRLEWVRPLSATQAAAYHTENVLRGTDDWNPAQKVLSSQKAVADITLNTYKMEVAEGESVQLLATVLPANAECRDYTWESLNPEIARIDANGNVTGLKEGTATVKAISDESGFEVKANVTVLPKRTAVPEVKEIGIQCGETILPGDVLKGTYTYKNESDALIDVAKVQWYVVNPENGDEILVQEGKEDFNKEYKVTSGDIGSQFKFVVIPETKTTYGQTGKPVASAFSAVVNKPDYKVPEMYIREPFTSFMANYTNVAALDEKVDTLWYGTQVAKVPADGPALRLLNEGTKGNAVAAWKILDTSGVSETDKTYNGNNTIAANITYQANASVLIYNAKEAWTNYNAQARVRFSPTATGFSGASYWDMYIGYDAKTHSGYRLNMRRGGNTSSVIFSLYKVVNGEETEMAVDSTTFENKLKQAAAEENPYFRVIMENNQGQITAKIYIEGKEDEMAVLSFKDEMPLAGTVAFENFGKAGCPLIDMLTVEQILAEDTEKPGEPNKPSQGGSSGGSGSSKKDNHTLSIPAGTNNTAVVPETGKNIAISFTDLKKYSWAEEAIYNLAERGIINGVGEGKFAPASKIKRCDSIVMLVRLLGSIQGEEINVNEYADKGNFNDVPQAAYYANYLAYAKANELVKGSGENAFLPNDNISRQDMMVMMVMMVSALEAMNKLDLNEVDLSVLNNYSDSKNISDYAKPAVALMIQKGVITGTGKGIEPKSSMTRVQSAVMMHRFMELFAQ